jgi:hypothetical protein
MLTRPKTCCSDSTSLFQEWQKLEYSPSFYFPGWNKHKGKDKTNCPTVTDKQVRQTLKKSQSKLNYLRILSSVGRASRHNSGKRPTWRTILCSYMFISILYVFRATPCSSSGESVVSIQRLVYVTLCRWPSGIQVRQVLPDLHTRRPPTQSYIYQTLYWYNWFSWWWARCCSKHVEDWNKHTRKKNCASSWSFTRIKLRIFLQSGEISSSKTPLHKSNASEGAGL